jgi:hypothetical protein
LVFVYIEDHRHGLEFDNNAVGNEVQPVPPYHVPSNSTMMGTSVVKGTWRLVNATHIAFLQMLSRKPVPGAR